MAITSYSFGKTLLKIDNVSLEYDGRPVLSGVTAEVRDIIVPGCVKGRWLAFSALPAAARQLCSASSRACSRPRRAEWR